MRTIKTSPRRGFTAWRFPARRAINSRPDRRGAVEELVVSNVTPASGDQLSGGRVLPLIG